MSNFDSVREFLDSFLETGLPGFDCAIYHRGECVLRHWNGYSSLEEKTPIRGTERYQIYSCTKPITATAVLMLVEEGKLGLEDRLADYIPAFSRMYVEETAAQAGSADGINLAFDGSAPIKTRREAKTPITIRQLLSMKAGFSYDVRSPSIRRAQQETGGRCPTLETVKYLAQEPLRFEPGQRYAYSLSHDVLAAVVEVITGMRFGQFLQQRIFAPLGMEHTTLLLPEALLDEVAEQYNYEAETNTYRNIGKAANSYRLGTEYESGGAGCVSTVDDYMKFLEALRTGKLLKPETVDLMTTPQLAPDQYPSPLYSYGLGVRCPKEGSTATDFGWGGSAGAYLAVDREHEFSFFYVQHAIGAPNNRSNQITGKILEVLSQA